MLVDDDAVESELIGILELVEVTVVQRVAHLRVEVLVGESQRRRWVLLGVVEVVGQIGVGHEVEEVELHRSGLRPCTKGYLSRNSTTACVTGSGRSPYSACPTSGMTTSPASRMRSAYRRQCSSGVMRSSPDAITRVSDRRSEENKSELQSLVSTSYSVYRWTITKLRHNTSVQN